MNNEKIKQDLVSRLEKYQSETLTESTLRKLREDLQNLLDNHVSSDEGLRGKQFPIEIENELGKWRIEESGETFFWPKNSTKYIEVNMTIESSEDLSNKTIESYE